MPQLPEVLLVDTGVANLRSIRAGLLRAGTRVRVVADAASIAEAERVVLPGVGAFGSAMDRLRELDVIEPLRLRIAADRPTLAICLGLQVLGTTSEESPGAAGIGVFAAQAQRFDGPLPVPQLGWNEVSAASADPRFLTEPGWFYFANSYRITSEPDGWAPAHADYGGRFVAALERGNVLACQFHPELSSTAGARLIERWVAGGER